MSTIEHEATSHHSPPEVVARQQRRAVLFFILADAVFYGSMLFTYFYLRALDVDGGWLPDKAQTADTWLVWVITAVTIASAVAYRWGEVGLRANDRSKFMSGSLIGLFLVLVASAFMVYQGLTWPLLMSDGSYASTFIFMAWVQFLHLLILLFLGLGIWNRASQGKLDGGNDAHATVVGYFWYWVALTALLSALTTFWVT